MLNLIQMELQRCIKSKAFFITLISYLTLLGICMYFQNQEQIVQHFVNTVDTNHQIGFYTVVDALVDTPIGVLSAFARTQVTLFFGIFMVIFISAEYTSGYIKNSCMMYKNRKAVIINKIVLSCILSCILVVSTIVGSTLLGFLLIDGFHIGDVNQLLIYSIAFILVLTALFSLVTFLCTLTQNKVVGLLMVMFISTGFIIYFVEPMLIGLHVKEIMHYMLTYILLTMPTVFDQTLFLRAIVMSIFYIVIYSGLSVIVIQRKDL